MLRCYWIIVSGFKRLSRPFVMASMAVFATGSLGQPTVLNVTNFGALGDAVNVSVNTVSNSYTVTTTNQFTSADIGKVISIFGAGLPLGPTNAPQDLPALIVSVSDGTNLTLSRPAGFSANLAPAIYGTCSSPGFQACINAAIPGSTILIPAGSYLLIPPVYDTNWMSAPRFSEAAVYFRSGGFNLIGDNAATTTLIGNGAWQTNSQGNVYRGIIFGFVGPVTNNGSILFQNLTFDGGVSNGAQTYKGWPANANGDGWDITHDAWLDSGTSPWFTNRAFINCNFQHWRGEMVKSNIGFPTLPGLIEMTNCLFNDGNASGVNFAYSHILSGCTFTNLNLMMEFYEGYMAGPAVTENSLIINCASGLALLGAESNHVQPSYTFRNNSFVGTGTGWGILFSPAQNLTIQSNNFSALHGGSAIITSFAGYQSIFPTINSNILIANNSFINVGQAFYNGGGGEDSTANMIVSNNTYSQGSEFANGLGGGTNITFVGNISVDGTVGLDSWGLSGQWYIDDSSNEFPPHTYSDFVGTTNVISYAWGMRALIKYITTNSVFVLDDTHPQLIPPGVYMTITNAANQSVPLYSSAATPRTAIPFPSGYYATFHWTNGTWQLFSQKGPPPGLRIAYP